MRTGNSGRRFHLNRVVPGNACGECSGYLEVLADVFYADWFFIKTQAVASLVRNGFGQGCVDVQVCPTQQRLPSPNNPKTRHISVTLAEMSNSILLAALSMIRVCVSS